MMSSKSALKFWLKPARRKDKLVKLFLSKRCINWCSIYGPDSNIYFVRTVVVKISMHPIAKFLSILYFKRSPDIVKNKHRWQQDVTKSKHTIPLYVNCTPKPMNSLLNHGNHRRRGGPLICFFANLCAFAISVVKKYRNNYGNVFPINYQIFSTLLI